MKELFTLLIALTTLLGSSLQVYAIPVNVAIGKPTTASSAWTSFTSPNKAVDNNVNTRWVAPAFSGWLEVDLTTVYSIDTIELVGIINSDNYNGSLNYYTLEYRTSNTDPWSLIGSGVTSQYYDPIDIWNIGGIPMRYIRYSVSPGNPGPLHWAHLSELRAFTDTPSVPEPSILLLFGAGLGAFSGWRRVLPR